MTTKGRTKAATRKAAEPHSVAPPPPAAAVEGVAGVDRALVARALKKVANQQQPTRDEQSALRRYEKAREEHQRWAYYRTITQKHWRQMSGRQAKVLIEQAERYGIAFGGAVVDLPKVVRQLHDFLAENALKLARDEDGDPLLNGAGGSSPALEEYRRERAALARYDRLERERVLLPREEVRQALGRIATIMRGVGDSLQAQFGAAAGEMVNEGLADAQREIDRTFGQSSDGGAVPQREPASEEDST
jgi:hypothetical protein